MTVRKSAWMSGPSRGRAALTLSAALLLTGCGGGHQIQRLASPDGGYVLIVDYLRHPFGTRDVAVSLEERGGLAAPVARFGNIGTFVAGWLGPEDIGICQMGEVVTYKTHLVLNTRAGNEDFYIHYKCPLGAS